MQIWHIFTTPAPRLIRLPDCAEIAQIKWNFPRKSNLHQLKFAPKQPIANMCCSKGLGVSGTRSGFFPDESRGYFSILEIIFLHYVARSFCETIKLPKEMPKIAKCLKCLIRRRRTIDFIKKKNMFVIISTCWFLIFHAVNIRRL